MVAALRLLLAVSALVVIRLDPAEPDRFVGLTYSLLAGYSLYSAGAVAMAFGRGGAPSWLFDRTHWIDVGWFTALVAVSSGTNSLFFSGYLFATLVASVRFGAVSGLRVAAASAVLVSATSYATHLWYGQGDLQVHRLLLRPVFLGVLGFLMASRGGLEITLKRRMSLLHEVSRLSNPRFGVDRTIGQVLRRVRAFYDADRCVLLARDPGRSDLGLRTCDKARCEREVAVFAPPRAVVDALLALPPSASAHYRQRRQGWWPPRIRLWEPGLGRRRGLAGEACEAAATLLDADAFVTVPVRRHGEFVGRLFVAGGRGTRFRDSDTRFLEQMLEQVMPMVEHVWLLDRLASSAAILERQRLAGDLHDSVVQGLVGAGMALHALARRSESGEAVHAEIRQLADLVDRQIDDTRAIITGLKEGGNSRGAFEVALRQLAETFAGATGIAVRLDLPPRLDIPDRLAAEAFQIVNEALSNVRRHTAARSAEITARLDDETLVLRAANPGQVRDAVPAFVPRSIRDRAASLGGDVEVLAAEDGSTVVDVRIPL